MKPKSARRLSPWHYPFWIAIALTLSIYILRGLGILTFLPGGILMILGAIAVGLAIGYGINNTRRF
jgi:hypothetical protein